MIKEYFLNKELFIKNNDLSCIYNNLSNYRKEKVDKYYNVNKRNEEIATGYLLEKALVDSGIDISKIKFYENEYGKPYIDSTIYFSISNSADVIYIVISDREVGCDIEKIADRNYLSVAKKYFSENEYNLILDSDDSKCEFYKVWTIKEAYLKCIGKGLNEKLSSFDVYINKKEINNCVIEKSEIKDGYACSIVIKK